MEHDTDRPGGDYSSFDLALADPAACQAACRSAAMCLAWTYVAPGVQGPNARCWLKSQVPAAMANSCCVSGVKTGGAKPTRDKAQADCEAAGGTWRPGGLLPEPLCFHPMPDAGKPCDRASQCQGDCLVVEPAERTGGMPGRCAPVNPIFGCFAYMDDLARQQEICVD
jgi:hypothetical protein